MGKVNDRLRKLVDNCDNVQGFWVNHSLGGGTGSGLGALILERIAVDYMKKDKFGVEVVAGDTLGRQKPVEAYNQVLGTHRLLDNTDVSILFDNSKLSKICQTQLDISRPTYGHVNSLIAKTISGVTTGVRFGDSDLTTITTDLVPFPRLHFMTTSLAGLKSPKS